MKHNNVYILCITMPTDIMLLVKGLWGHVTGTERLANEATPAQQTEFEKKGHRAL